MQWQSHVKEGMWSLQLDDGLIDYLNYALVITVQITIQPHEKEVQVKATSFEQELAFCQFWVKLNTTLAEIFERSIQEVENQLKTNTNLIQLCLDRISKEGKKHAIESQ